MRLPQLPEFDLKVTSEQHAQFAKLSGDFNPLHTDPEFARRSQFGTTVVHGVHVVLRILDRIALIDPRSLQELVVEFRAPVRPESEVSVDLTISGNTVSVKALQNDVVVTKMNGVLEIPVKNHPEIPDIEHFESGVAPERTWEDSNRQFKVSETVGHQKHLSSVLFPELTKRDRLAEIDVLLAVTRVIGMKCPGRYALLRSLTLHRTDSGQLGEHRFHLKDLDSRMRLVRLSVSSTSFTGVVEAHHRRPHVRQSIDDQSRSLLTESPFAGMRALIVGGSRGLGELAARAIVAGAGEVLVTYSRGRSDSLELQRELGEAVKIVQLDVFVPTQEFLDVSGKFLPTHLLYFASPQIMFRGAAPWDNELFARFCSFYVDKFAWLMQLADFEGVYTPSSSFVTSQEFGYREYVGAKSKLEEFCESIQTARPGIRVVCDRLPPLATDQNSGLFASMPDSNLPTLLPSIMKLIEV